MSLDRRMRGASVVLAVVIVAARPAVVGAKKPGAPCSQQTVIEAVMNQCAFGAAGTLKNAAGTAAGWVVFDTGGSSTLVRTAQKGDLEQVVASTITVGDGFAFESSFSTRNNLWDFRAPGGGQIATIGTDIMKAWAVRLSTADGKIYLADDKHACAAKQLVSAGFHRLDTAGYYQRTGKKVIVTTKAAAMVPTVEINLMGYRVPAQLDTGYMGAERQLQINKPLLALLRETVELGPPETRKVGKFKSDAWVRPAGDFALIDSDTRQPFGRRPPLVVVVKEGDGGIAAWSTPAAQMSSSLFFEIADAVELRADQHTMWVHARTEPLDCR